MANNQLVPGAPPGAVVPGGGDGRAVGDYQQQPFADDPAALSAHRILSGMSHGAAQTLSMSFEALQKRHPHVADAIIVEMEVGAGGTRASPASDQAVKDFIIDAGEAGKAAVSYWGGPANPNTRARLGTMNQRFGRILAGLSPADQDAAFAWLDSLPGSAQVGIYLEMSA